MAKWPMNAPTPKAMPIVGSLFAAAGRGFLEGFFDGFPDFGGALLNKFVSG
jgi:hypothetical protein